MTSGGNFATFDDATVVWIDYPDGKLGAARVDPDYETHLR
jgi:hypothetical protein